MAQEWEIDPLKSVVASFTRPTTLIGTVGHKWIANEATQGFAASVGRCAGISSSEPTTADRFPPQPTQKEAPQPLPGEIVHSPPAHADPALTPLAPARPTAKLRGWIALGAVGSARPVPRRDFPGILVPVFGGYTRVIFGGDCAENFWSDIS